MEEERDRIQNLIYKKEVLRRKLGKVEKAIVSQEQVTCFLSYAEIFSLLKWGHTQSQIWCF